MKRRKFNKILFSSSAVLASPSLVSCSRNDSKNGISLAQWSLNKMIKDEKKLDPLDFAKKANELGFDAIEYVSTLYRPILNEISIDELTEILKSSSNQYEIKNLLIMVDDEGDLASSDESLINKAVDKHKKWVKMANKLGCHSIRVNLTGENELEKWKINSVKGLTLLCNYAENFNVNIIVENHGGNSSIANELADVIKNVNLANCGTLPDFGNFCVKRENGSIYSGPCKIEYDKYKGMRELMPYAKAVSAKSYDFDQNGNETTINYEDMMSIVKKFNYYGYLGIEFEGNKLSEVDGIELTKKLIEKHS